MPEKNEQIIIIGAGPVGLEAALYARTLGYDVQVLEKRDVANHIRQWQHVRLFSPFSMNHTALGKKLLTENGVALPGDDEYLTGGEFVDRYLAPLAKSDALRDGVVTNCEVIAISRERTLKSDHIGDGERKKQPFRILTRDADGREKIYFADVVIDTSGTYSNPNWLGDGGIPALGELANRSRIVYHLEDLRGRAKDKYLGKTTLLVGDGQSAGTTIQSFETLLEASPDTRLIWLTRLDKPQPIPEQPDDPLPGRKAVAQDANRLTQHPRVRWIKNAAVQAIEFDKASDAFSVQIAGPSGTEQLAVDRIIANVGYGPDNNIYRELQVHECYASRGPMKLSAALLADASSAADCLTQTGKGPDTLKNPEPDFYILGMKSYGRNANFLMRIGFEQIRDTFKLITGDPNLNLYAE